MCSLGPKSLSGQGTVSQEWKIRVAGVLELHVSILLPLEGRGHSKSLQRFSLGQHIAGVPQWGSDLHWSRAGGRTSGMVILPGIYLLELICMDFLRGSGRRKELICVQEPKGKGVEEGGRDGVVSVSQLSVILGHDE